MNISFGGCPRKIVFAITEFLLCEPTKIREKDRCFQEIYKIICAIDNCTFNYSYYWILPADSLVIFLEIFYEDAISYTSFWSEFCRTHVIVWA